MAVIIHISIQIEIANPKDFVSKYKIQKANPQSINTKIQIKKYRRSIIALLIIFL